MLNPQKTNVNVIKKLRLFCYSIGLLSIYIFVGVLSEFHDLKFEIFFNLPNHLYLKKKIVLFVPDHLTYKDRPGGQLDLANILFYSTILYYDLILYVYMYVCVYVHIIP